MGILVDIRKMHGDLFIDKLVDASKVRKKWWGKRVDSYWSYLDHNMGKIDNEIDPGIIADFFVYIFDQLKFKELLENYSAKISANRNAFVLILVIEDRELLLNALAKENFLPSFKIFLKELNGEFYNYEDIKIEQTISDFKTALNLINSEYGLLINIG